MESTETLNFDIERVGSSKRRISSILKTPRTSVEAGLKEPQENKSKPTEKRRSSRRVSFAATKNVVFFPKDNTSSSDEQTPSPSLTPMGSDSQGANRGIHDGFENLLKARLQISHQREKSTESADFDTFLASISQQKEVKNTRNEISCKARDQTMLFGEDTACMDLTNCHAVVIENDSNATDFTKTDISASGMFNTMNIGSNMLQRNAVSHKSGTDTDFGLFLASLKKKGLEYMSCSAVKSSSVPTQKVDSEGFLAKLNARRTVIDKESNPPGLSDCSVPEPQGFRLRKSTVLSTDYDFMDLTKNHTVAIDGGGFLQNQQVDTQEKSWAIGRGNTNTPPITQSQTVVIDAKHKMNSEDNDPNVQSQPIDCRNNFFPMTDVTLSSSQASALQMSTACEEMEFTSGKATALDSDPTEVSNCYKSSTKKFCPFESLISKSCKSEEITNCLSFVAGQKSFFPSLGVDNMELTIRKHVPACSQVTRKSMPYMATESKSQCSSAEGNDMNMKSTYPLPDECDGTPPQEQDPVNPVSQSPQNEAIEASNSLKGQGIHYDRSTSLCTDKNVGSAKTHPVSPEDQKATERRDPAALKEKSRRKSPQDLRSKLRRISQTFNTEPVQSVVDSATVPLPCLDLSENVPDSPKTADASGCRNQTSVEVVSEQMDNVESTKNVSLPNNETKPLTTQLSFGFLPKLPSRPKPVPTDHLASETTNGFKSNFLESSPDATSNLLDNFDEMDNINAEQFPEMSEEDISEGLDDHGLMQTEGEDSRCNVQPLTQDLEDDEFLSTLSVDKGLKRSCPDDGHDDVPLEQKRKQDVSPSEVTGSFTSVRWDANTIEEASNMMTKMIDGTSSSSNSTYLKSEATFESTNKYCHCDSQIEKTLDYELDFHKKIEDESITVREFLRHFGIGIVIHRSCPSSLSDNLSPNPTPQFKHLLKELYIYRPKQRVYEAECVKLTDMVEGLMSRMLQQDHPLRHINESLLPELANLSKEQLLTFGSKLKEKKVYFRKRSKMVSHEMKIGMYSELVHTTQEAKQKLEEKMLETNALLKDLDVCIHDLEAELAAVDSALRVDQVHAQSEIQPAIQQELKRLDGAVAEKEGQIVHMESEKKKKAEKIERLREEVKEIEKHTSAIHSVNEWKLSLKEDERTQFNFLYKTLFLEVVHQPSSGMLATNGEMEQKLCSISFDFQLDTDKSECHTVMVHDLLSQLFLSEKDWLYSNSRDYPMLLHEVSLAVSRIRLLGEEIHRLKRWGALRLGILEINCADRQVQILFSSLKAFVKFQLTLAVTCAYPFGGVKIQSFQNYIGNTRIDQIEDLFSSIEPAKGYFTKIIKAIHDHLLI